jgi:riboflavin kinase/FMN adenylyltransferase
VPVLRGIDALPKEARLAATVGVFDGVHLGHQQVFRVLEQTARRLGAMPVVITFDPHPEAVVLGQAPDLLMDQQERLEWISRLVPGGFVVLQVFDAVFRRTTAEEFMRRIGADRNLVGLVMTHVSAFGRDRGGTLPVLQEMGRGRWETIEAPTLDMRGARVSSARIRELVSAGRLDSAARLLGRAYALVGDVVHGERRGRELGFPTANIHFADPVCLPPDGIYAAHASWGGEALLAHTEHAEAVVSLGTQPTFGGRVRLLEVHLLDRDVDVYGQRLRVELCRRIRRQQRFDSAEELIVQMGRDVVRARSVLARGNGATA